MTTSDFSNEATEGLRERKRRETRKRITEAGVRLFSQQGYDATTLDAIAAEAGISRRTFFHYFKSKDDILLSLQSGLGETLAAALAERSGDMPPFAALREAMLGLAAGYAPDELMAIDRLMLSSEAVQARKQAGYLRDEMVVFDTLCAHWPAADPLRLRLLAILSVGVSRVSLDVWRRDGGSKPIVDYVRAYFDAMGQGLQDA